MDLPKGICYPSFRAGYARLVNSFISSIDAAFNFHLHPGVNRRDDFHVLAGLSQLHR